MAHFDSGFFFLVGNISIIAWGRSFLLRYDRSISGSTAVRSNQPHRIESRDQTDPHTGQSTVHIKDQRKSSTCMERQQRHSVEFRLITLCVIFFHKKLCDSSGELAEIVGGKDRRALRLQARGTRFSEHRAGTARRWALPSGQPSLGGQPLHSTR